MPKIVPESNLVPVMAVPDDSSETEIEIDVNKDLPDIDIEIPNCYGTNIAEPEHTLDENSWPLPDKDYMPDQPGQNNELGIEMPRILENLPGEP